VRALQQPRRERAAQGPQGVLLVSALRVRQVSTGGAATDDHGAAGGMEATPGPRSAAPSAAATADDDVVKTTKENVTE